jgi:hypothetical protein
LLRKEGHQLTLLVGEGAVIPLLTDLLQKHCGARDFLVDVHNFPEMSSSAVPRVIYVTLSDDRDDSGSDNLDTTSLEHTLRAELARAVPAAFSPVYLEFRRGALRKSIAGLHGGGDWWWGRRASGERDAVCAPKNVNFRATPVMGMSIGPATVRDAASLGGFVRVGADLFAVSAFHAFEDAFGTCKSLVVLFGSRSQSHGPPMAGTFVFECCLNALRPDCSRDSPVPLQKILQRAPEE